MRRGPWNASASPCPRPERPRLDLFIDAAVRRFCRPPAWRAEARETNGPSSCLQHGSTRRRAPQTRHRKKDPPPRRIRRGPLDAPASSSPPSPPTPRDCSTRPRRAFAVTRGRVGREIRCALAARADPVVLAMTATAGGSSPRAPSKGAIEDLALGEPRGARRCLIRSVGPGGPWNLSPHEAKARGREAAGRPPHGALPGGPMGRPVSTRLRRRLRVPRPATWCERVAVWCVQPFAEFLAERLGANVAPSSTGPTMGSGHAPLDTPAVRPRRQRGWRHVSRGRRRTAECATFP